MTTFLTQGVVANYDVARSRVKDRYAWHQKLWKFFPDVEPSAEREFLWRIDRKESATVVWILSERRPQLPENWGRWATKEVAESFLTHERYEFALCANPTVMRVVRLEDGSRRKNGRRTAISGLDELKEWLKNKGTENGFELEQTLCEPPTLEYFYKSNEKRGVHSAAEFRGVLRVVDREKFSVAWERGVGPAKGFGFGLLLLKPLA